MPPVADKNAFLRLIIPKTKKAVNNHCLTVRFRSGMRQFQLFRKFQRLESIKITVAPVEITAQNSVEGNLNHSLTVT